MLIFLGFSFATPAQPLNGIPRFRPMKVEQEIVVDGVLNEPFWERCAVATGLIDTRTHKIADQQTTIRVAYTQTHVFVGVECFDDRMAEIRASERRADRAFTGDDWVEIHFDPTHSRRSKYAFFTNPLGTRAEANEGPSGEFNYGWTVDWECEARLETNRWCFEMKIPLGAMNYLRKDAQTWGFNVTRSLKRLDQLSFWSYSPTDMYKPRHFGHLEGFDLADSKFSRLWEVTPYVSARHDFGADSETVFKAGGDVGFRLAPSVTAALSLNPDYGQVEADDATIELRDTERFLTEKRPFFREGEELMRMPHRLYYSRRFTDIDAAAKFTGAQQNFSFNFQSIYGTAEHQDFSGSGNSALLRVYQYLQDRSYIGYYLADSELDKGFSRVGSVDGYFFLNDTWRIAAQASAMNQDLEDALGTFPSNGEDYLGQATLIYGQYPWDIQFGIKGITEGFKPLLGYIPRQDVFGPNFDIFYGHRSDASWYKELSCGYGFDYYWNEDRAVSLHDHAAYGRVVFPNDFGLRSGVSHEYHAPYQNHRMYAGFDLFATDFWRSLSYTWARGRFEEVDYHELVLGKPFKPWNRIPVRFEAFLRFEDNPDGSHDTEWLTRAVFDLYMTDQMWLKGSLQPQSEGIHNVSLIYGWEFLKRKHVYLVFNSVNDGEEGTVNSIFSKVAWTF